MQTYSCRAGGYHRLYGELKRQDGRRVSARNKQPGWTPWPARDIQTAMPRHRTQRGRGNTKGIWEEMGMRLSKIRESGEGGAAVRSRNTQEQGQTRRRT